MEDVCCPKCGQGVIRELQMFLDILWTFRDHEGKIAPDSYGDSDFVDIAGELTAIQACYPIYRENTYFPSCGATWAVLRHSRELEFVGCLPLASSASGYCAPVMPPELLTRLLPWPAPPVRAALRC